MKAKVISLKGKDNFINFSKDAVTTSCDLFVLMFKYNKINTNRIGIIASRKIGNAVHRNKAKRRIKAGFSQFFHGSNQCGYDFLLILRKKITEIDSSMIKSILYTKIKQITKL